MPAVFVSGGFDDPGSRHVRFLQEAARRGAVHVLLWPDETLEACSGRPPRFTLRERSYFLEAIRFVDRVTALPAGHPTDSLPDGSAAPGDSWAVSGAIGGAAEHLNPEKRAWCARCGVRLVELPTESLAGFSHESERVDPRRPPNTPKVMATGSFDWLHTGHVRFFEEAAALGELIIVIGHDANIRLLKGDGHPRFPQEERLYMVSAVRSVSRAFISTGSGWLDAEPEIGRLRPDCYVVNEDGDKPEKRQYCEDHGIQYVVLKRAPRQGLPRRSSTDLRGF